MTITDVKNNSSTILERPDTGCSKMGRKIKERRLIRGLSQGDLGDKVGVSFQQIQKYESGRNNITIDRLYAIAEALSVNITDLLLDDTSTPLAPTALHEDSCFNYDSGDNNDVENEMLNLMREYRKIKNKEARRAIYLLTKSLSSLKD